MLICVSEGEVLDRLSILEIKESRISDSNKRNDIKREIDTLSPIQPVKDVYIVFYKMILFINTEIWNLTDTIKSYTIRDDTYAAIAHEIFELNQQRFRVKDMINMNVNSTIRERKSYAESTFNLVIDTPNMAYNMMIMLYLSIMYDRVKVAFNDNSQEILYIQHMNMISNITRINEHDASCTSVSDIYIPEKYMSAIQGAIGIIDT